MPSVAGCGGVGLAAHALYGQRRARFGTVSIVLTTFHLNPPVICREKVAYSEVLISRPSESKDCMDALR
jgi:hypothetical protein